ncbi:uncharacterized protein A4U43_C03F9390 [Asparagus officinalis]|uniref:FBD domain-containing protein n=2 Tax=Asparagus officinalis TaxID=4686 RepID=A0A5P1F9E1_ASPOF|nr:uncharacterized protein A4U43_C03F9390 [Asparagus officinalis]
MVDCLKVYYLEISAPKLQSLILFGNLNFMFRFIDISSLVDAFLSSIGRETYGNCTMFLPDLAHVKILSFALSYVAEFEEPEENEAEFTIPLPNLQELQMLVDVMSEENISQIYRFFHIYPSPFLEKLLIRLPGYLEDPTGTEYIPTALNQPTNVVFDHLKEIKLSNFRGCILEMRLVKFLLEKAITLERLVLIAPPMELNEGIKSDQVGLSLQSKFSERIGLRIIRGQLSTLPKASLNVSIVVQEFFEDDMSLNPVHREVYCEQSFSSIQKMFEPSFEEFVSAQSEFL